MNFSAIRVTLAVAMACAIAGAVLMETSGIPRGDAAFSAPEARDEGGWSESGYTDPGLAPDPLAPKAGEYSIGEPTDFEQFMLELVNRARANPGAEADRLGIDLNADLEPGEIEDTPKQPLAVHPLLTDAAVGHSEWLLETDSFSHTGEGGSTVSERIMDAGYPLSGSWNTAENLAWQGTTGEFELAEFTADLHDNLFLSSGHRVNLMNGVLQEIGIGILTGSFTDEGTTYNAAMATQKFARSGGTPGPFVVGVVYEDLDENGFYTPGEGVAGVRVDVDGSGYHALTPDAGGFAVPVPGDGSYEVSFSVDGVIHQTETVTVQSNQNVKVDYLFQSEPATGSLTVALEPAEAVEAGAAWRVGGDWRHSGESVVLAEGDYTVTFGDAEGWTTPSSQVVTIEANETAEATGVYEEAAPPETGLLEVTIEPEDAVAAGAQWSVDGGETWRDSGDEATLPAGGHPLSFREVEGWSEPGGQDVEVQPNETTIVTATYTEAPVPETGALEVNITPGEAVEAGAQWSVDGGAVWNATAQAITVEAGAHTVTFREVPGWIAPEDETVTVDPGATATLTGEYQPDVAPDTGELQVFIEPAGALDANAGWRVNGDAWLDSGQTLQLETGTYEVSFRAIPDWRAPEDQTVTVEADATVTVTGVYESAPGSGVLEVSIEPSAARNAGAQWRLDGGPWRAAGAVQADPGTYEITFHGLPGWEEPGPETVTVEAGATVEVTGAYTEAPGLEMGTLEVTIEPPDAIAAGAEWSPDGGETWRSSGSIIGIETGEHEVTFRDVGGWGAPAPISVHVGSGEAVSVTGEYEPAPRVTGDVNGDGQVTAVDVQLAINAALGFQIDPSYDADMTGDGNVTATDIQIVINAALGII